ARTPPLPSDLAVPVGQRGARGLQAVQRGAGRAALLQHHARRLPVAVPAAAGRHRRPRHRRRQAGRGRCRHRPAEPDRPGGRLRARHPREGQHLQAGGVDRGPGRPAVERAGPGQHPGDGLRSRVAVRGPGPQGQGVRPPVAPGRQRPAAGVGGGHRRRRLPPRLPHLAVPAPHPSRRHLHLAVDVHGPHLSQGAAVAGSPAGGHPRGSGPRAAEDRRGGVRPAPGRLELSPVRVPRHGLRADRLAGPVRSPVRLRHLPERGALGGAPRHRPRRPRGAKRPVRRGSGGGHPGRAGASHHL
ncbi:MAG: hypothetical protein AVDCRST_MAG76-2227, partial [uncultured Acidimicrobiales bacterium]